MCRCRSGDNDHDRSVVGHVDHHHDIHHHDIQHGAIRINDHVRAHRHDIHHRAIRIHDYDHVPGDDHFGGHYDQRSDDHDDVGHSLGPPGDRLWWHRRSGWYTPNASDTWVVIARHPLGRFRPEGTAPEPPRSP